MEPVVPALVGRERELATLGRALDEPAALVLIEGEAGIGKSRLLQECLGQTRSRLLLVRFPAVQEPFPLGALIDGVRRMQRRVADLDLTPLAGALRPLFPEWADELPPAPEPLDDPRVTRHQMFRALAELVDLCGIDVVVVEDAHWADSATLEWLLIVLSAASLRIPVVVSYRPAEVPADSLLPRLTSRRPDGRTPLRLCLDPLDLAQTRSLMSSMLPDTAVSSGFAAFVHRSTEGLPLAIEETVRLLAERGDVRDDEWHFADLVVPPSVRDLVLERVHRLSRDARRVLQAAAVLGEPVDEALLGKVSGLPEQRVRRGVAVALRSGLLQAVGPDQVGFRHVLHAKAVEEAIAVSERRRMDRRAAEALEEMAHPDVVRLCRHYRKAGDVAAWSGYAQASAELALQSGDHSAAVTVLLDLLSGAKHPPSRRAQLARRLGAAATTSLTPLGAREAALRELLERIAGDRDLEAADRGEIRLLVGRLYFQHGDFEPAGRQLRAAIPDLSSRPASAARAMLLLAEPECSPTWPVARHLEWAERAASLLPRIEAPQERRELAMDRAISLLHLGEPAGWRAAAELGEPDPTPAGRRQRLREQLNLGQYAIAWGHYQQARRDVDEVRAALGAVAYSRVADFATFDGGLLDWYTGSWPSAATAMADVADAEHAHPLLGLAARTMQGVLDLARGYPARAERCLGEVAAEASRGPMTDWSAIFSAAGLARLRLADGAADAAIRVAEPVMEMLIGKGLWLLATDLVTTYVEALAEDGRLERAGLLLEGFATWATGRTAPAPAAALSTCRAILAQADGTPALQAARLHANAAGAWAALPRPYDELLAVERQGRSLLASRDRQTGVTVLGEAYRRLREMGARWDAERVARLLREHGAEVGYTSHRGRRGYGTQLSPRELEVTALVAEGLTNRQIGERLFLAHRTVDRHLSGAMRKFGVTSRTRLALAAAEAGLLATVPATPGVHQIG